MADELLKEQVDVLKQANKNLETQVGLEFDKIRKAFAQMGNLLDLSYLEISVLLEILIKKSIFTQEEFVKCLEETSKKVEAEVAKANKEEKSTIIT